MRCYKLIKFSLLFGTVLLMYPFVSFAASLSGESEIQVAVSRQDAGGKTQKDLTIDFLNNFESLTVERLKVKTKETMAEKGFPNTEVTLSSGANYFEYGSVKLAVVKINVNNFANQVWVAGIRDNELIRIACVRKGIKVIPISYGVCGDKITEVFGIKFKR